MTSTPAVSLTAATKVSTRKKAASSRAAANGSCTATAATPPRKRTAPATAAAQTPVTVSFTSPSDPPRHSKQHQLAMLLLRDEGATVDQMIAATGWLPHTTRAALTGLRKKGYAIDSDKVDGVRTYRAVAPQ